MEIIYFTITGILLYVVSDMILNKIEAIKGERLPNRSIVFFVIIFVLAVVSFNLIQHFLSN